MPRSIALRFVAASLLAVLTTAAHALPLFVDNFQACTYAGPNGNYTTGGGQIGVNIGLTTVPSQIANCAPWTFTGTAYLTTVLSNTSGNPVPAVGSKAVWLNEFDGRARGEMSRPVSGLTVGHSYTVTADAWTDETPGNTALGLAFGTAAPVSLFLPSGSGARTISKTVCAQSTSLTLRLFENGTSGSSPVVTNITVLDDEKVCSLTVTYDSLGGSAVPIQTVGYEGLATQPLPPQFGAQVFDGWYTDAGLGTRYDFATPVTQDITLYAKWVTGPSYTVSGTIQGLEAGKSVGLTNSNGDQTAASGTAFGFTVSMANLAAYAVNVNTQPLGQTCSVTANGSGTINASNVINVQVTCLTIAYPISGTVVGLAPGQSVVLENSNGERLTVSGNSFAFLGQLAHGSPYAISVLTQPNGQVCSVTQQGSGTVTAPVTGVVVTCVATTVPPVEPAIPVPSLSQWALWLLTGFLAWLGVRRFRAAR